MYIISSFKCTNCGACEATCPVNAISRDGSNYKIDSGTCIDCAACVSDCPTDAISAGGTSRPSSSQIMSEANLWQRTPYLLGGDTPAGVDCSHLVNEVYNSTGLGYDYRPTSTFAGSPEFTQVTTPQRGDVILFSGHMGIYEPNPPIPGYVVYSATTSTGVRYAPTSWFKGTPKYYRRR